MTVRQAFGRNSKKKYDFPRNSEQEFERMSSNRCEKEERNVNVQFSPVQTKIHGLTQNKGPRSGHNNYVKQSLLNFRGTVLFARVFSFAIFLSQKLVAVRYSAENFTLFVITCFVI